MHVSLPGRPHQAMSLPVFPCARQPQTLARGELSARVNAGQEFTRGITGLALLSRDAAHAARFVPRAVVNGKAFLRGGRGAVLQQTCAHKRVTVVLPGQSTAEAFDAEPAQRHMEESEVDPHQGPEPG